MSTNLKYNKTDFPIFRRKFDDKDLVYLDSAATSQSPQSVIDSVRDFEENHRANVHRGIHFLSQEASELFDYARSNIGKFIGCDDPAEIIFTRGATEGINLVARTWAEENIHAGDKIVTSVTEHHSNFVPWQQLAKKRKAKLEIVEVDKNGNLILENLDQKLKDAKLLAITHASNVLGTINPIKLIVDMAHKAGAKVLIDGAQAIPHIAVNVKELDVDFYVFSGHKMLGPTGIGVLYAKKPILEEMQPFHYGGDMISEVKIADSKWNELPYKFEAGTPNISGAIGLSSAVDYLKKFGMDNVRNHEVMLLAKGIKELSAIGAEIIGSKDEKTKTGVLAFNVGHIHPHDVADILNGEGIAIRAGHHCAMPLHDFLGLGATSRASFYLYNDENDIDRLIDGIKKVQKTFL